MDVDDSVKTAGALIIELLPNHVESDIAYLEKLDLEPISSVLDEDSDLKHYLYRLFPDAQILEEKEAYYHCGCSKERFMRNLLTLPRKDLEEISADEKIEIKCEFCEKIYRFDQKDIKAVLQHVSDKR